MIYPDVTYASIGVRLDGNRDSFVYSVNAGEVIEDSFVIENPDEVKDVSIFAVDRFKSADGFYLPKKYEKDSFFGVAMGTPVVLSLGAQTVNKYSFKMIVPKNFPDGGYYGEIMVQEQNRDSFPGMIKITSGVGINIHIIVTGGVVTSLTKKDVFQSTEAFVPEPKKNFSFIGDSSTPLLPQKKINTSIAASSPKTDLMESSESQPNPKLDPGLILPEVLPEHNLSVLSSRDQNPVVMPLMQEVSRQDTLSNQMFWLLVIIFFLFSFLVVLIFVWRGRASQ